MSISSVLLFGGGGFLGQHLIREFWKLEPRPEIHVFDIRPLPKSVPSFYEFDPAQIHQHVGDVSSEQDVIKAIKAAKPTIIVHSVSPHYNLPNAVHLKVNVEGTRLLLRCAKELGVHSFCYTSSAGVLFTGDDIYDVDETLPYPAEGLDQYNTTKMRAEKLVLAANSSEFRTTAIRPSGIFGPGDLLLVPSLRRMSQLGQHKIQLGDNNNLFDVTYVGNIALAHLLACQKLLDPATRDSVAGEAFIISNDQPIYFWSFAKTIWALDGIIADRQIGIPKDWAIRLGYLSEIWCWLTNKSPSLTRYRAKTTCAVRYFDISKAKALLSYKPRTTLEDGLRITLKFMQEEDQQAGKDKKE